MASAYDFTQPYVSMYRPPPRRGVGVCEVCHGAPSAGYRVCMSCTLTIGQVSRPTRFVVPISLSRVGDQQLHHVLWNYKNGRGPSQDRHRSQVAATIARFIDRHALCLGTLAMRSWDIVTTVPSSQKRPGTHPIEEAVQRVRSLQPRYERLLEPGPDPIGHRRASDHGYVTTGDVGDAAILLIDDTFTTGAAVQSAASALRLAGAACVIAVVVGRVIDPDFSTEARALWEAACARVFDFDVCCLE
jgi:predicted amidophosphoribosyltransferase